MPDWLPSAITWLISTGIGAAVAYAAIRARLASHETRLGTVEDEIRTLRLRSHDHTNAMLKIDSRVAVLEERTK